MSILSIACASVLFVALLIAVMFFADAAAFRAVKRMPRWSVETFHFLTEFGRSGWFLFPLAVLLLLVAAAAATPLPRFVQSVLATVAVRLEFLFAAIAIPGLLASIIKRVIARGRPYVGGEGDPFLYNFLVWRSDYASLFSGHATTAFAAAVAFGTLWPRLRPLMWSFAIVIAASRVVSNAHFVSDVIAGAAFGCVGALLVRDWFASRRLGMTIRPDGSVMTLPGPSWQRIKRVARRVTAQ
jgi:undecaprenyl-diphosphatase